MLGILRKKKETNQPYISTMACGKGMYNDELYYIFRVKNVDGDNEHFYVPISYDTYQKAFYENRVDELEKCKIDIRDVPVYEIQEEDTSDYNIFQKIVAKIRKPKPNIQRLKIAIEEGLIEIV